MFLMYINYTWVIINVVFGSNTINYTMHSMHGAIAYIACVNNLKHILYE